MADEKMKILKMLEEGKLSAEDAAKLLSTISAPVNDDGSARAPGTAARSTGGQQYSSDKRPEAAREDWGKKFDSFMKEFEPKFRDISERVVEHTARFTDSLSKSLSSGAEKAHDRPARTGFDRPFAAQEKSFEIRVTTSGAQLNLSSVNGGILLKGYNGDQITARVYYKAKRSDASVNLMSLGNKFYLNYDEDLFDQLSIDAYVPYSLFSYIALNASNGEISVSGIECGELSASSSNSAMTLRDVKAGSIKLDAQNAKELRLSELVCRAAECECSNGTVILHENDIENLRLVTFNSPVDFSISELRNFNDYLWILETSNQKLALYLPTTPAIGYYIKAQSSLGSIRVGLTGLNYIFSDKNNTEAKSIGYDAAEKKVRVSLETSNAPLIIN